MRKTHTEEFCAPVTAANRRGWANRPAHQGAQNTVGEFCASWHVVGPPSRGGPSRSRVSPTLGWKNASFGETRLRVPQRISPHLETVLPHPRGEIQTISPHPRAPTGKPQTTCARHVGRNSPNFAPREKERISGEAKIKSRSPSRSGARMPLGRTDYYCSPHHSSSTEPELGAVCHGGHRDRRRAFTHVSARRRVGAAARIHSRTISPPRVAVAPWSAERGVD
jgi:hypothetical protein